MKVLVTGGSGFLGSWVASSSRSRVTTCARSCGKSSNRKHLHTLDRIEFAEGSVEDAKAVAEAVKGVDAIVHCAGLVKARDEDELAAPTCEGTQNLVDAAKEHTPKLRRFVHVSSLEAGGPSRDGKPVSLEQERPATAYGRSKLAAEKVVLAAKGDLPVTVLRPGAIYGPRDAEILEAFKSVKRGLMPDDRRRTRPRRLRLRPRLRGGLHPRHRRGRPERQRLLRRRRRGAVTQQRVPRARSRTRSGSGRSSA